MIDPEGWTKHPLERALPADKFQIQRWNTLDGQFGNHCDQNVWYAPAPPVVRAFHKRLIEVMELPLQAFSAIEVGKALADFRGVRHEDDPDSGQLVMIVTLQGRRKVAIWRGKKKSVMMCTRGHVYIFPAHKLTHQVFYKKGSLTLALRSPGMVLATSNFPHWPAFLN